MGYFDRFQSKGIPFMENRDKGDMHDIVGEVMRIDDFGFIRNEEGEDYAVISFSEKPDLFYFGNKVYTDMLKQVQADGMEEELAHQYLKIVQRESKKGREYFAFEFTKDNIPF